MTATDWFFSTTLVIALSACGRPPDAARSEPPAPSAASAVPAVEAPSNSPREAGSEHAAAPSAERHVAPASRSFPPPEVAPPHPRSAEAGDGRWEALGDAKRRERAADEPRALYATRIHPHPTSRFITLTIVAADLTALRLGFMAGVQDVGKKKLATPPGFVPEIERERLVAVFNGGFQPRHGRWGMVAAGEVIVPPRKDGCTIALGAEGSVQIRSWPALVDQATSLGAYRQTPPCLVEAGAVHANLFAGRDKAWGGRTPGLVTRRRSAIGIDATGRVLFYGVGVETSPRLLAEGMRFAGAESAAELDINWNWTRFLLFGTVEEGRLGVSSALVDVEYGQSEYVGRAADRDFFYLLRR